MMRVRWALAAFHLLALGIGLGAVWAGALALRQPLDDRQVRWAFYADNWWGIAALVWIATGLARAFGGLEKGSAYYLHNHLFLAKMGALALILLLEVAPMTTLVRWRIRLARHQPLDTRGARLFSGVSFVQAGLVALMVVLATGMARGFGSAAP